MFNWKVEDLVLIKERERGGIYIGDELLYSADTTTTREDKIAFVDSMRDGKLSYALSLVEKFDKDRESLPKDQWGDVKTVSLKAWIRKNDSKNLICNDYNIGKIRFTSERFIQCINNKSRYDTYEDFVDEIFHRELKKCAESEKVYFEEHDEYSILKKMFHEKADRNTTFGVNLSTSSNREIRIVGDNGEERDITIDELKELLDKYKQIDELVAKITAETHIVY